MHSSNHWKLDKTNVKSEFIAIGELLEPEEFTQKLQIVPNRICSKGEKINNSNTTRDVGRWELFTEYEESLDINNQLKKIYYKLIDKKDLLKILKEKMELEYVFDFAINIKNRETPAIYFEQKFIGFCKDIGAIIDIDTYVDGD